MNIEKVDHMTSNLDSQVNCEMEIITLYLSCHSCQFIGILRPQFVGAQNIVSVESSMGVAQREHTHLEYT